MTGRRTLPEPRLAGPVPWLIAVMVFLSVLAAAAGVGLGSTSRAIAREMAGRATIQILEADPALRDAQAAAAARAAAGVAGVISVRPVPEAEIAALVEPWLGALGETLPQPALIDVELASGADARLAAVLARVAPSARIDAHARWLGPVNRLVSALSALSIALVALIAAATAATVVLAARGALDTHRGTIEVLHLLGATDGQIARLFQRRFAIDAMTGGIAGFVLGVVVLAALGQLIGAVGSDLLGTARPPATSFVLLLAVPLFAALVATVAARLTIVRALGRML